MNKSTSDNGDIAFIFCDKIFYKIIVHYLPSAQKLKQKQNNCTLRRNRLQEMELSLIGHIPYDQLC